jgi:hypothetical protein
MRKSSPLLVAFLLLAACTPKTINSASYALGGHRFRVPARAISGMGTPSNREGLDIEAEAPEAAFRLSLLTYTYSAANSYTSVSYTLGLRGKLTRLPSGGFTGQFYGSLPASTTGHGNTVRGTFKVAAPPRKTAVTPRNKQ